MAQFFCRSGRLVKQYVRVDGSWPTRTFTAVFEYESGAIAEHDGKTWKFQVMEG